MCNNCEILKATIPAAKKNPYANYAPVIMMLIKMEEQKRIEQVSGECKLSETIEVLSEEREIMVRHTVACKTCGQKFYVGAFIRGVPSFDIL